MKGLNLRYTRNDEFSGMAVDDGTRMPVKRGMDEGFYLFAIDRSEKMWAMPEYPPNGKEYHHNSLIPKGEGVYAAGMLEIRQGGRVALANAASGHFYYTARGAKQGKMSPEEAKAFEKAVRKNLESRGLKVLNVNPDTYFPPGI
jgi:hypothetical protein